MEISLLLLVILLVLNLILLSTNQSLARRLKIYDNPDFKRKIHNKSVPLTGGIFIIFNFIIITLLLNTDYFSFLNLNFLTKRELFSFIFLVLSLFLVGLYDDKYDIKPITKLFLLSIIITISILIDENLIITHLDFKSFENSINLYKLSIPLTILFILLFLNAINMFDGIDMQVSTYFIVISVVLLIKFNLSYLFYYLPVILFICFLNIKKKLFLGDAGTYVIAILISWTVIKNYNLNSSFYCDEIFLLMITPGIDMLRLFFIRIIDGKNPFHADKNHLHHLLLSRYDYLKAYTIIQFLIITPLIIYTLFAVNLVLLIILIIFIYTTLVLFLNFKKI